MREPEAPGAGSESEGITTELTARIQEEIQARGGTVPFSRFMDLCLYAPGLGYYRNAAPKFGPAGDFVTAPEISKRFGACLSRQVAQILDLVPGGMVLEVGAGSGRLAAQILRSLAARGLEPATGCSSRARSSGAARRHTSANRAWQGARSGWTTFPTRACKA